MTIVIVNKFVIVVIVIVFFLLDKWTQSPQMYPERTPY